MNISAKLIVLVISAFILVSCSNTPELNEIKQGFLAPKHVLETNSEYEVIWDISNIRIAGLPNYSLPALIGAQQKIIVQGMEKDSIPQMKVFALDSLSGKIIWTLDGQDWGYIIIQDNIMYRGTFGTATMQAFNSENAELIWSTRLPWAHSTSDIYFSEHKIYVQTNDDEFFVLNEQGKILDNYRESFRIFLESNGVLFMEDNLAIKAINPKTKKELWRVNLSERYRNAPIFKDETIFIRTWSIPTKIYSIDQSSGDINWVLHQNILSNLCVLGEKIYFVNLEGYLVAINQNSGEEISKVKFSPGFDLDKQIGSYFVTGDSANNVLAISFRDNTQIIGLRIVNP